MKKVLICGEHWISYTTHIKGFDSFQSITADGGVEWLKKGLIEGGFKVVHMPPHIAAEQFPFTLEELSQYDCVIFSDIGSNTLLLSAATFLRGQRTPNRLNLIEEYVNQGGAFCMVGGYMSFAGIEGKGKYAGTAIDRILPVAIAETDDRVEAPQGVVPKVDSTHPVFNGIEGEWPFFLGYNKTVAKEDGQVIATIEGDPFIAVRQVGKGRTAMFASDCAPHWGPAEFVNWEYYGRLWVNLVNWLTEK
jgi:uncharacterized membrane protein